jgi:hypothetical protein
MSSKISSYNENIIYNYLNEKQGIVIDNVFLYEKCSDFVLSPARPQGKHHQKLLLRLQPGPRRQKIGPFS